MSTHSVSVINITEVRPHPNADALEIVPVGGWQTVVRKGQFKVGDTAVYVEPDYVVDTTRPEFSFLAKEGKTTHRLKAVRLRGSLSFGLLIPLPEGLVGIQPGTNVIEALGIVRYVPPVRTNASLGDMQELPTYLAPRLFVPKFDLESLNRYPDIIMPGDMVVISEKVDGANAKYVWHDGKMYVGSRNRWLKPESNNIWTRVLSEDPGIEEMCRANPDTVLYGEIYGPVQKLTYGCTAPQFIAFAAFGPYGIWWDTGKVLWDCIKYHVPILPVRDVCPFSLDKVQEYAEKDSMLCSTPHMSEGVVVTPVNERTHPEIGRVSLKYISNRYWLDKNT